MNKKKTHMLTVVAAILLLGSIVPAAPIYSFVNITNNSAVNAAAGEAQLSVELLDLGGGSVEFLFRNSGPAASSIARIYFDNGSLGTSGAIGFVDAVGTVAFSQNATPGNLPGGVPFGFSTTPGLSARADAPVQPNGVNPGEQIGLTFSGNYADVADEIAAGDLRIGIHVLGFANGGSESFINTVSAPAPAHAPGPASVLLSGIGISIVGLVRNRKNASLY